MAVTRCQTQRDRPAHNTDDHGELGIEPTFGTAHRLRLLATGWIRRHAHEP